LLTALMILLFLGSWRSTLIVCISIPLSILTSLTVLGLLGETINVMTLGGLALAIGILVDDATVTIENIHRHMGRKPLREAVLEGASIYGAQLQGADLDFAQVWNLHGSPSIQSFSLVSHGNINWYGPPWGSPDRFDAWRNSILEDITPRMRNEALKRLSTIGPNPDMANVVGEEFWLKLTRESPFGEQFAKGRAAFFIDLACAKGSAPYVARGIIRNQLGFAPWFRNALFADKLQMIRLQHDTCPGAKLFTEQDWALLDKLVDESSSSATSKKKK